MARRLGLRATRGVHLAFLPPYSPELQPAGRRWSRVDEPVANLAFADLRALEDILTARFRTPRTDPPTVRVHARCRWWPAARPRAFHRLSPGLCNSGPEAGSR